jgi:phosphoribosyl-AMP cyclohydrolase
VELKFDDKGLIPVVVQDFKTGEVLMVAYMNHEAFSKTLATGRVHFFSRSRNKIWLKGESSGHFQTLREILTDCDRDTLVVRVDQEGGACHLGFRTCFVHKLNELGEISEVTQDKVFDPEKTYGE